jgi:hypothetical protein
LSERRATSGRRSTSFKRSHRCWTTSCSIPSRLQRSDRPFRKTHSLEEIGEQSLALDPALRPIIDEAVPLTEYAWKFRYPGEMEEPSRTEAEADPHP